MTEPILEFDNVLSQHPVGTLNLRSLYREPERRAGFEGRWVDFGAGVVGLRGLFRPAALKLIVEQESERLRLIIEAFFSQPGYIGTFQADAYELLRSPHDPAYSTGCARHPLADGYPW